MPTSLQNKKYIKFWKILTVFCYYSNNLSTELDLGSLKLTIFQPHKNKKFDSPIGNDLSTMLKKNIFSRFFSHLTVVVNSVSTNKNDM